MARLADPATATWVYPTVMLRYTRVHSRAVFSLSPPTVPPVLLRAEGTRSISLGALGFLVQESPCSLRIGGFLLVGFPFALVAPSSLCVLHALLSAQGSSCSAGGLRIHPGFKSSSRIRPAVSKFIGRFEGLPCPPCLLYSQLHGRDDLVRSAFS